MDIIIKYWPFLVPYIIIELPLVITALVHVLRHPQYRFGNKVMWVLIVSFVQIDLLAAQRTTNKMILRGDFHMKIEVGKERPAIYKEAWPGMWDIFSHFEFATAIPHILFAVTTLKENGQPNINYHSWSCFQGDNGGYYAILAGIYQHTHTYANIKRTGEFCVNFLPMAYMDALNATIEHNEYDEDEFAVGGFTQESPSIVQAPRIRESFLSLEYKAKQITDLSGVGTRALVIGEVLNVALDENYAGDMQKRYGENGFMLLAHSPFNYNI